jgi:hypothetical protein
MDFDTGFALRRLFFGGKKEEDEKQPRDIINFSWMISSPVNRYHKMLLDLVMMLLSNASQTHKPFGNRPRLMILEFLGWSATDCLDKAGGVYVKRTIPKDERAKKMSEWAQTRNLYNSLPGIFAEFLREDRVVEFELGTDDCNCHEFGYKCGCRKKFKGKPRQSNTVVLLISFGKGCIRDIVAMLQAQKVKAKLETRNKNSNLMCERNSSPWDIKIDDRVIMEGRYCPPLPKVLPGVKEGAKMLVELAPFVLREMDPQCLEQLRQYASILIRAE